MSSLETLAPIVLFVYNRLEHTQKTIDSLAKNPLAKDSVLYIFSDNAKDSANQQKVDDVRRYIDSLPKSGYFKDVIIQKAKHNKGLANSIISGVSKVIEIHKKVIVLEDDLLCSVDFLNFINDALNFYESNPKIGSISGYSPLQHMPTDYKDSIYIAPRSSSLGWATWIDRWSEVDWEVRDFESFRKDKNLRKRFDMCGNDRFDRLRRQLELGANSWSIRFGYWQNKTDRYTIFPSQTRIQHIGWDGSGVHNANAKELDTHIKQHPISYEFRDIEPNAKIIAMMHKAYSGSIWGQIARYLRNNGFGWLEKILRKMVGR
jgi:hypothetical protein